MVLLQRVSSLIRCLFQKSNPCIFPKIFYNVTCKHKLIRRNKVTNINNMCYTHVFVRWKFSTGVSQNVRRQKMKCEKPKTDNESSKNIPVILDMLINNRDLSTDDLDKVYRENQTYESPCNETRQLLEAYTNMDISVKHLEELMLKIRINISTYEDPQKKTPVFSMGDPDPSVPVSNVDCPGCGSLLQCQDQNIPGYIPSKKFLSLDRDQLLDTLCFRCFLMKYYNYCLNLKVSIDEYPTILSKIKNSRALVMVVVDMSDMNNSILKTFLPVIGNTRPLYVIGNKVDVIPMDSHKYLDHLKHSLLDACIKAGWNLHGNIKHVALVSAKTGYGIENLVSKLFTDWNRCGDIYLVGCTNVGKSSLFNVLLQSDLCKSNIRDLFERATVSIWPGTTMNLLKFPLLQPTPERMYKRKKRLLEDKEEFELWEKKRRQYLDLVGLSKNAVLKGFVGQTQFSENETSFEGHLDVSYAFDPANSVIEKATKKTKVLKRKQLLKMAPNLANCHWFYDTPGIMNPEQIINFLEPKELQILTPNEMLRPRTVKLKSTQVMYITGLACIEYVKGDMHVLVTVITNLDNPIHVLEATESQSFFKENIGTDVLKVPLGGKDRLDKLPPLVSKEFNLLGTGFKYTICDIVLSSVGWIGVSAKAGSEIVVRAYTPGGYGCHLRPPLLPEAVNLKKRSIKNSPFYLMKKPMSMVKPSFK